MSDENNINIGVNVDGTQGTKALENLSKVTEGLEKSVEELGASLAAVDAMMDKGHRFTEWMFQLL